MPRRASTFMGMTSWRGLITFMEKTLCAKAPMITAARMIGTTGRRSTMLPQRRAKAIELLSTSYSSHELSQVLPVLERLT